MDAPVLNSAALRQQYRREHENTRRDDGKGDRCRISRKLSPQNHTRRMTLTRTIRQHAQPSSKMIPSRAPRLQARLKTWHSTIRSSSPIRFGGDRSRASSTPSLRAMTSAERPSCPSAPPAAATSGVAVKPSPPSRQEQRRGRKKKSSTQMYPLLRLPRTSSPLV